MQKLISFGNLLLDWLNDHFKRGNRICYSAICGIIMPERETSALLSLIVALLFAAIFLFGGRVDFSSRHKVRLLLLSFAAGCSVAYTFVHVLPALQIMKELQQQSPEEFSMLFPEYSVYLWCMGGFLFFYVLETLWLKSKSIAEEHPDEVTVKAKWLPWVHIGGFALYAWFLTYLMLWNGKSSLALCLYAVAIGMHIFPVTNNLSSHYGALYNRRGAYVLAVASLAGWLCALTLDIPKQIMFNLLALVAGGVVVNSMISELPRERKGKFLAFLSGAFFYTALLLLLSHFE